MKNLPNETFEIEVSMILASFFVGHVLLDLELIASLVSGNMGV